MTAYPAAGNQTTTARTPLNDAHHRAFFLRDRAMMKIEIKSGDEWIPVQTLKTAQFLDAALPMIQVVHDPASRGYQALVNSTTEIATLRIDGVEGRYGIDFDDCPRMAPDCITFNWLSIGEAQQIPAGSTLTMV